MKVWASFLDEMEKIAAKVPVLHGTFGRWKTLKPQVGLKQVLSDPNPKGLYFGTTKRAILERLREYAKKVSKNRGGEAVIAHAKIDTRKGWTPAAVSKWGRENIGGLEEARDIVEELDRIPGRAKAARMARGPLWEKLQRGVGTWTHPSQQVPVKPIKYRKAR